MDHRIERLLAAYKLGYMTTSEYLERWAYLVSIGARVQHNRLWN